MMTRLPWQQAIERRIHPVRKSTRDHPCVFTDAFVREQIDPRVQNAWKERWGKGAPFGRLRLLWREEHCATLNPYESASCPYAREECALAFLSGVTTSVALAHDEKRATGYFRKLVRSTATIRADEKPRRRHEAVTHPATRDEGPGDVRDVEGGDDEGRGLRRTQSRPVAIGDVLRGLDVGPRPRRTDDGEAGAE
jgi:hypothetical protein